MEMLKRFEPMFFALMIVGALNWAVIALFDTNVLTEIFGTGTLVDIVYVAIGASALAFLPKLMDELHLGHGAHPRGV